MKYYKHKWSQCCIGIDCESYYTSEDLEQAKKDAVDFWNNETPNSGELLGIMVETDSILTSEYHDIEESQYDAWSNQPTEITEEEYLAAKEKLERKTLDMLLELNCSVCEASLDLDETAQVKKKLTEDGKTVVQFTAECRACANRLQEKRCKIRDYDVKDYIARAALRGVKKWADSFFSSSDLKKVKYVEMLFNNDYNDEYYSYDTSYVGLFDSDGVELLPIESKRTDARLSWPYSNVCGEDLCGEMYNKGIEFEGWMNRVVFDFETAEVKE